MISRVICKRIKQCQEQPDRKDRNKELRRDDQVVFRNVVGKELLGLKLSKINRQVRKHPEKEETELAICQGKKQFAQQISVKQPHGAG